MGMDSLIDGLYQRKFTADKGQPRRKGMAKLEEWLGGHGAEECAGMGTRLAERARDHLAWGGQAERAKAKVCITALVHVLPSHLRAHLDHLLSSCVPSDPLLISPSDHFRHLTNPHHHRRLVTLVGFFRLLFIELLPQLALSPDVELVRLADALFRRLPPPQSLFAVHELAQLGKLFIHGTLRELAGLTGIDALAVQKRAVLRDWLDAYVPFLRLQPTACRQLIRHLFERPQQLSMLLGEDRVLNTLRANGDPTLLVMFHELTLLALGLDSISEGQQKQPEQQNIKTFVAVLLLRMAVRLERAETEAEEAEQYPQHSQREVHELQCQSLEAMVQLLRKWDNLNENKQNKQDQNEKDQNNHNQNKQDQNDKDQSNRDQNKQDQNDKDQSNRDQNNHRAHPRELAQTTLRTFLSYLFRNGFFFHRNCRRGTTLDSLWHVYLCAVAQLQKRQQRGRHGEEPELGEDLLLYRCMRHSLRQLFAGTTQPGKLLAPLFGNGIQQKFKQDQLVAGLADLCADDAHRANIILRELLEVARSHLSQRQNDKAVAVLPLVKAAAKVAANEAPATIGYCVLRGHNLLYLLLAVSTTAGCCATPKGGRGGLDPQLRSALEKELQGNPATSGSTSDCFENSATFGNTSQSPATSSANLSAGQWCVARVLVLHLLPSADGWAQLCLSFAEGVELQARLRGIALFLALQCPHVAPELLTAFSTNEAVKQFAQLVFRMGIEWASARKREAAVAAANAVVNWETVLVAGARDLARLIREERKRETRQREAKEAEQKREKKQETQGKKEEEEKGGWKKGEWNKKEEKKKEAEKKEEERKEEKKEGEEEEEYDEEDEYVDKQWAEQCKEPLQVFN